MFLWLCVGGTGTLPYLHTVLSHHTFMPSHTVHFQQLLQILVLVELSQKLTSEIIWNLKQKKKVNFSRNLILSRDAGNISRFARIQIKITVRYWVETDFFSEP